VTAPFSEGFSLLDQANSIFLTSHVNPDGDAVGSILALGLALQERGKNVTLALQDPVPVSCRFLPGADQIVAPPVTSSFDLAVVLDCENPNRAGTLSEVIERCPEVLVMDHHLSDRSFGTVEIRDTSAAATGEILAAFLKAGKYPILPPIADCLMTALMLDTGGFRHSNASPSAFRLAAELVERGARVPVIYRELFENRTFAAAKLMGAALNSLQQYASGQIVTAALRREDFECTGAGENETDGINNQLIGIQGAEASALFREASTGGVRVSLRSRSRLDCNAIARHFGGGGHLRAAGCTVHEPLPEAIRLVVTEMEARIRE
jgi:phosphoesterase RecJ-like protein